MQEDFGDRLISSGIEFPFPSHSPRSHDMGGSPGELSEELVMQEKRKKSWRMNCDVFEETEGLENEL